MIQSNQIEHAVLVPHRSSRNHNETARRCADPEVAQGQSQQVDRTSDPRQQELVS